MIEQSQQKNYLSKILPAITVSILSIQCIVISNVSAHENYSARYIVPGEIQEWQKYDEEKHGEKEEDTLNFNPGYYIGLGVGSTHVDPEGQSNGFVTNDDSDSGFKLYFGRHFRPNWAWEVSYADLGEAGLNNPTNLTLQTLVPNAAIDYTIPAGWIKYLPLNPNKDLSVDIKVGIAAISNSANDSRIGFNKQTSTQLAFGLGAQWRFAERFYVRFDADSYDKDANYLGVSVGMYLGGHDDHKPKQKTYNIDADKDGVLDWGDQCPDTPLGTTVDDKGCQKQHIIDADKDGVFDWADQCPQSQAGDKVDATGCVAVAVAACKAFPGVVDGVNFKTNSAELTESAKQVLTSVAQIFKANPNARIEVQAHTDSRGSASYNLGLSERRAASVKQYLIELGVSADVLQSKGYGETRSIDTNDTKEGRAKNRRVELQPLDKVCQ